MVFLTDDTLRRNVALGVPDQHIDDEAVQEAVRLAQLQEFVDQLPDGLETTVGERGVRVSGGQRQRVAIARALYRRPSVLVFDEGTSVLDNATDLDNATEALLMDAIERLRGQHTIILVAHRLSTVRNCDRIVSSSTARWPDLAALTTYALGMPASAHWPAQVEKVSAHWYLHGDSSCGLSMVIGGGGRGASAWRPRRHIPRLPTQESRDESWSTSPLTAILPLAPRRSGATSGPWDHN
jgi:Arc/MetJ family transcription regulator